MSFLAPWAAWFLAGVPVIVLLYLLKPKRRAVSVSTLLFWERLLQESRQRTLFQKLRQILSLLLHLLIFLLLVGALAKPAFDRLVGDGAATVLVVDIRARMQALEPDGRSRFERAREQARQWVRAAGPGSQFAILSAGPSPRVVTSFTGDEGALIQGLEALSPTDASGDLAASVKLADALLASRHGAGHVIVLSDGTAPPGRPEGAAPLQVVPCGSPLDNVAITAFATRPLLASPQTSEVLLRLHNFGKSPVSGTVEIALDGQVIDVRPFQLGPRQPRTEVFPAVRRPGGSGPGSHNGRGWLTARLDINDAMATDNRAFAVLSSNVPRRVLLVSPGNWFLEKLLEADQQIAFELLAPEAWQPQFGQTFDAVVFDRFLPPNLELDAVQGNFLFLRDSPFNTSDPALDQPLVSDADSQHPTLRLVSLQNTTILRANAAQLPTAAGTWRWQAPLKSFEHPLLIAGERPGQRMAALAFDPAESDLPLHVAFPLLISNTLHWLSGEPPPGPANLTAGQTLELGDSMTASPGPVDAPAAAAEGPEVRASFQPMRNGFYRLRQPPGERWLAVNTFSEAESDLHPDIPAAERPGQNPSTSGTAGAFWPLWQHLALAGLLLFAWEWWLFHRRHTE